MRGQLPVKKCIRLHKEPDNQGQEMEQMPQQVAISKAREDKVRM
jgi:hypothetical protein